MTQESDFDYYWRLGMKPITHADELESYKLILDSGLFLSMEMEKSISQINRPDHISDALTLFQMTLTKGITLYQLAHGIDYNNPIGEFHFNKLIDPMSMSAILRSQFEAFTNFHNIYIYSGDKDTEQLLYDLWVVAGLKERQRFADLKLPDIIIPDELIENPHITAKFEEIQVAQSISSTNKFDISVIRGHERNPDAFSIGIFIVVVSKVSIKLPPLKEDRGGWRTPNLPKTIDFIKFFNRIKVVRFHYH